LGRGEMHFFSFFERRISTILFRSGFFVNIYDAKEVVKLGFVFINSLPVTSSFTLVQD
jgi:ribosomal protein S4